MSNEAVVKELEDGAGEPDGQREVIEDGSQEASDEDGKKISDEGSQEISNEGSRKTLDETGRDTFKEDNQEEPEEEAALRADGATEEHLPDGVKAAADLMA